MGGVLAELGTVAREQRLKADLRQLDIATTAGVDATTISRFESGQSVPEALERIVGAYETECELEPLTLWKRALKRAD